MSTLMANGFIVTQHTDHNVSISRNGRDIVRLKLSISFLSNDKDVGSFIFNLLKIIFT